MINSGQRWTGKLSTFWLPANMLESLLIRILFVMISFPADLLKSKDKKSLRRFESRPRRTVAPVTSQSVGSGVARYVFWQLT